MLDIRVNGFNILIGISSFLNDLGKPFPCYQARECQAYFKIMFAILEFEQPPESSAVNGAFFLFRIQLQLSSWRAILPISAYCKMNLQFLCSIFSIQIRAKHENKIEELQRTSL